jgi:hypothetical protein
MTIFSAGGDLGPLSCYDHGAGDGPGALRHDGTAGPACRTEVIMSHPPFQGIFLGVVLCCLATSASAGQNSGDGRTQVAPAAASSRVAGRSPTRGRHRRRAVPPRPAKSDSPGAKAADSDPSVLPKLVGKKPVTDDPLAGLKKL